MDRSKMPFCNRCKLNYQISDTYRAKIPLLLDCGHDMCKNCIQFMHKKNKQIICEVCRADCKIENESDINNIPVHYYLVGKVWYLIFNKQKEIYRNISNLQLRNLTSDVMPKENICDTCHKCSVYFCYQCHEMYCENCYAQQHENKDFYCHDVILLSNTNPEFVEEKLCDHHLKPIDIICVTCQLDMCSICAIEDHRPHDIQLLEKYNLNSLNTLQEYSKKGENLLKKLKFRRDRFKSEMIRHQDPNRSKNKELEAEKRKVTMFIYSAIGILQCMEQNMLKLLNEVEVSVLNSINKITNQLSDTIDNLQNKLNKADTILRKKNNSSAILSEVLADIEHVVNTTYYIAQKEKAQQVNILFNYDIFVESINRFIVPQIEISDIYLLGNSPELPPNYSLHLKIDNAPTSEQRPSSSLSSKSSQLSEPTSSSQSFNKSDRKCSPINHYASYVKEITKTEIEMVIITHLNSPSDFYVQLNVNISIMKLIEQNLNEFINNQDSIVDHIEKNMMYAVLICNQWYRGTVVNIIIESNQNMYMVHCIDYGFTKTVTADRIKNVTTTLTLIPPLAYNCALYNLKPSLTTGWSNEAYSLFSELMLEKTGSFYLYAINLDTERIEVELVWKLNDYKLPIRQAMFFLGYGGCFEEYVNDTLHKQLVFTLTLPKPEKLEKKEKYNIILSHLVSPSEFYFRIDNGENERILCEVMELLDSKYKPTEIDTHKSYLLYTPQIGMAVAAKYTIDSNWYRAKIISLPEPCMVTVFYIDYGNSETLFWNQLRVLDKDLIKIPPLAVRGSLADIHPAEDGIECSSWNDQACAAFIEFTENYHKIETHLTALVHDIDYDTYNVILYNHTSRGEFCVNQKLLTQGYGANSDPMLSAFQKPNVRKPPNNQKPLQSNRRITEIKFSTDDDSLGFVKNRQVDVKDHIFPKMDGENVPGVKMSVFKVVSPYDITLKYYDYNLSRMTDQMNKVYTEHKIKNIPKTELKKDNLCAVFIEKYGNWYRGKIVNVQQKKKTTSIYLYDLDETFDQILINTLYVLENRFVQEKCGLLHCCMDRLIPLGVSDGNWPKFSCDRLIEELQRHSSVYFSKTRKKDNKVVLGELWVRDVVQPKALEPLHIKWINMNKFLVEQGFAITDKQNLKDHVNSNLESNMSIDTCAMNSPKFVQCWLPPTLLTKPKFNACVMYVDMKCNIYFQLKDDETSQLLKNVEEELNDIFIDSKPEPENYKWTVRQMVIAQYHLDKKWYRGTILKKISNDQYQVQFLDYGNIETCSHKQLRSTVYMTDIPQLCIKGYFTTILPCSKDNVWKIFNLDFIHSLLVEKSCTVTFDLNISAHNVYAISAIKTEECPDICQFLVSKSIACYTFAKDYASSDSQLKLTDELKYDTNVLTDDGDDLVNFVNETNTTDEDRMNTTNENDELNTTNDNDELNTTNDYDEVNSNTNDNKMNATNIAENQTNVADDNRTMYNEVKPVVNGKMHFSDKVNDKQKPPGFSSFCLKSVSEVIEGMVCDILGPTSMRLLIYRVNGIEIINMRDQMHANMFTQCANLQLLENFEPGTAVVVLHNVFWRRGVISDDCNSVILVDMGISIKLVKKNLRFCPPKYFELPMFSIECRLANVTVNEHIDKHNVAKEMSKLLRGVNLKITGVDNLDANIVDVELFNDNGEIAYQPLIDSQLLIPK